MQKILFLPIQIYMYKSYKIRSEEEVIFLVKMSQNALTMVFGEKTPIQLEEKKAFAKTVSSLNQMKMESFKKETSKGIMHTTVKESMATNVLRIRLTLGSEIEKKLKKEKLRILLLPYRNNKLKSIWKSRKKDKKDSLPMKRQEKLERNCIKREKWLIWRSKRLKSKNIKDIWRSLMPRLRKKKLKRKMKLIMLRDKRSWTNSSLLILSLM